MGLLGSAFASLFASWLAMSSFSSFRGDKLNDNLFPMIDESTMIAPIEDEKIRRIARRSEFQMFSRFSWPVVRGFVARGPWDRCGSFFFQNQKFIHDTSLE